MQHRRQFRRNAAIALAAHAGVIPPTHPTLLRQKGAEGKHQQHQRQHRRPALVMRRAHHGEKDICRQHVEIARQHQRIAEIRQTFDKPDQKRIRQARPDQRPGYGAKNPPPPGPQRRCRFLQARRHALQHAQQHQKRNRREGQHLRNRHSFHSIQPAAARNIEMRIQEIGDEPGAAEHQNQRQPDHKRRRNHRQQRQQPQQPRQRKACALRDQRERQPQQR